MGALTQELLVRTRVHLSHYFVHFVAVSKLGQLASDILVPRRLFAVVLFNHVQALPVTVGFGYCSHRSCVSCSSGDLLFIVLMPKLNAMNQAMLAVIFVLPGLK